eukprot:gene23907-30185_t
MCCLEGTARIAGSGTLSTLEMELRKKKHESGHVNQFERDDAVRLKIFATCPKTVRSLQLQGDDVNDYALSVLIDAHGAQLTSFSLKYMKRLTLATYIHVFSVLSTLTNLSIFRCTVVSGGLIVTLLAANPSLTFLDFESIDWRSGAETDEILGLGIGNHCKQLRFLKLEDIRICDTTVKHIGENCVELLEFHVDSSTFRFTMAILETVLQGCKQLRACSFSNECYVSDDEKANEEYVEDEEDTADY